jgi:hypothetical protein
MSEERPKPRAPREADPGIGPLGISDDEIDASIPDPRMRKIVKGLLKGMESLVGTAGQRVLTDAAQNMTDGERAKFSDPEFQIEYKERVARFFERAPDSELIQLGRAVGLPDHLTPQQLKTLVGPSARRRTIRGIGNEVVDGVPLKTLVRDRLKGRELPPLSAEELARLARSFRLAAPFMAAAESAARERDLEGMAGVVVPIFFAAPALMLRAPPPGEPFGKKNRSEILLPTDRKHCAAPNCDKVISNRRTYCPVHSRSAVQERDTQKKGQIAMARRLRKTIETTGGAGATGASTFMGDTLPEEFAPTTRRKRSTP